jgi:hypothetical protein
MEDVVEAVVISPYEKQLDHARGLIEQRLYMSGCSDLLHPDDFLASSERPPENWFLMDGAAGVIRYFVASRPSKLVGSKASVIWLNEAGLQEDDVWRNVRPLLWETESHVICEGTPELGEDKWFVRVAISGLPADHPKANPRVSKPRQDTKTFLGSSLNAYLPRVREESRIDRDLAGKDSVYTRTQIDGDWSVPDILVFTFDPKVHLATLDYNRGAYILKSQYGRISLPQPDLIIGACDWMKGRAPAGFLETKIWYDNPCRIWSRDPYRDGEQRTLIVVDYEYTTPAKGYSDDSYCRKMVSGQDRRGVAGYHYDPSSATMAETAERIGVVLRDTTRSDKDGRIGSVQRSLNYNKEKGIAPSLFIDVKCKRVAEQLAGYKRARDKKGNPKDGYVQYNDWFVDCLAYLVPHVQVHGIAGMGF